MTDHLFLAEKESGLILIDILTQECFLDGNPIKPLNMADILNSWLIEELTSNNIPIEALVQVKLIVNFDGHKDPKSRKGSPMFRGKLECHSVVKAVEAIYESNYSKSPDYVL